MPDGESISGQLESLGWGAGAAHMALAKSPCGMCNGTGEIHEQWLVVTCPCRMVVEADG